ncbi:MAG TPA: hypothetical protein VFZ97_19820, partial [Acidimicrobiales bacterium]
DLIGEIDAAGTAGQIGPTRDYWVSGLSARNKAPGAMATVTAASAAIPEPRLTASQTTSLGAPGPTGYVEQNETWTEGPLPPPSENASIALTNVATITVDAIAAGLGCATLTAQTDGPTALTLTGLKPGSAVYEKDGKVSTAGGSGTSSITLSAGKNLVTFCSVKS